MDETARKIFARPCSFAMGVARPDQLPVARAPEVAFAGRSNVGKSSLLNALTGRKDLARTSHTPGRTQQLNFYHTSRDELTIVDMPGYGYARVSKATRKVWDGLIFDYLRGRAELRLVCLLVDARHGLKDSDREMMTLLDTAAVSYRIVLTKADKQTVARLAELTGAISAELTSHPAAFPDPLATSAHRGDNIGALKTWIAGHLA